MALKVAVDVVVGRTGCHALSVVVVTINATGAVTSISSAGSAGQRTGQACHQVVGKIAAVGTGSVAGRIVEIGVGGVAVFVAGQSKLEESVT